MEEFITYLVKNIVVNEEEIKIEKTEDEYSSTYTITVNPDEYGKIIGKKGKTITAIRNISNLYQRKSEPENRKRVYIKVGEENTSVI
ncbi:MAG TPA: KH domain-containing protein [Candidatus Nitrosocosmicus sp.]|nr:KH domain-containing protein [Candidatus Nitrosocosmicus sp.]